MALMAPAHGPRPLSEPWEEKTSQKVPLKENCVAQSDITGRLKVYVAHEEGWEVSISYHNPAVGTH